MEEEGRRQSVPAAAAAGELHAGNTRSRQGEAAVGIAAARGGAAAVAAAVGLLP